MLGFFISCTMKSNFTIQDDQAFVIEQAVYSNGYTAYIPWSNSIGFKVNAFRHQEQTYSIQIAHDFLANISFVRNDVESECSMQTYFESTGTVMLSFSSLEDNKQFKKIELPDAAPLRMSFDSIIQRRRSIRQYTGDSVSLSYLASIIKASMGITTTQEVNLMSGGTTSMSYRATPSAGGVYPVELYVVALNIEKLEQGIYQYNAAENCLVNIHNKEIALKLLESFSVQEDQISIKRSGFIGLLIGTPDKAIHKYGNRGLGFTFHEVGAISQNIHLAATCLGLGSVDCASYYNDEAHRILRIDGIHKNLLHTVVVGVSQ